MDMIKKCLLAGAILIQLVIASLFGTVAGVQAVCHDWVRFAVALAMSMSMYAVVWMLYKTSKELKEARKKNKVDTEK